MLDRTQAWHWQNSQQPQDLVLKDCLIPVLQDDQVLIENRAIGLNPVDWKLMAGFGDHWQFDQIPGVDGMGVIVAVGKNVQHLRIGARCAYHTDLRFNGSFSQHTIVSAKALIAVPDQVSDEMAAAFPCPGLTAWQAFEKTPPVQAEHVLVNGAGGAVGRILTQLLINAGAKVYATASVKHHQDLIHRGVVKAYDYHDQDWRQQLEADLGSQRFYAVYDMVNGESARSLADLLGYYGHLISVQDRVDQAPLAAFSTSISLHEIALAAIHRFGSDQQWAKLMRAGEQLLAQIARQQLSLTPIKLIEFAEIPQMLEQLKQQNDGTKYVVKLTSA
jgi:NADPH:quinone reductase-like Zn-dependent oxidoreductase